MIRWYLDASAAAKLMVAESESAALIDEINRSQPHLVASLLLETELRRMVHRFPQLTRHDQLTSHEGVPVSHRTSAAHACGAPPRPEPALTGRVTSGHCHRPWR
ncbi:hypothetical protein HMPREF9621_01777 [Cutibacterium modestum HL037PA2]|uniref:PIN domain-containing protein n=1 Tax=Cutibacterium modestum HL044PA1 TaxID=765109 RepID=A0ABN0C2Z7_9ACTN|nr:hypothetical protein HMPREF9621_01777 [Cutibacterium modestum HL037PA2]EFS91490.1 hypothetical protein HMPREF9607_02399 [Cutibacterium modestum HL044PA1]REB73580.1 toxin PIN [Cutibacterium modestum]